MRIIINVIVMAFITAAVSYSQMSQQWASIYNGPLNNYDIPYSMTVDGLGNVYVTGMSVYDTIPNNNRSNIVTIKYDASGIQQWAAVYDGPGHPDSSGDIPTAIAVDNQGNVYVTGWSMGYSSGFDWATIKYNSSGVQQWIQRYAAASYSYDIPKDLKVDGLGNVYVTGRRVLSNTDLGDFVTIKYNTSGVQQWIRVYDNQHANGDLASVLEIDNIGNVYVTGESYGVGTHFDYATIKYNSSGDELWARRSNSGGEYSEDKPYDMAVDNFGNVIVTGRGVGTVKFNSSGDQQWVKGIHPGYINSIAADAFGNVYITGPTSVPPAYSNAITKISSSGDSLWVKFISNVTSNSRWSISIDRCLGYIYTSGPRSEGINSYLMAVRYNSFGDSLWSGIHTGNPTAPSLMVTDGIGNTYVTGFSITGTNYDIITFKYAPTSFFIHAVGKKNVGKQITDNQSTSDSVFVDCLSMNYATGDVNVKLDSIVHTKVSDLEIYLTHNNSTDNTVTVDTLVYQAGGTGQNFIGTLLNDSASIPIGSGTAPFTGTFRPHGPLSAFNGQGINGSWVLRIYDRASGNTGVLKAWSINFLLSVNPIGIQSISNEIPKQYSLSQNYPNPFNPTTNFEFRIADFGFVNIKIFDLSGKEVETLVNENLGAGTYKVDWNASNYSSGVYFYKLEVSGFSETKKMILIK
ncbi:MAG: SBBP repeat-containing protein [Ignavibacteria bacterium]|nr:SBBP repeat-containing protein [Ignavibacteria bacterium]